MTAHANAWSLTPFRLTVCLSLLPFAYLFAYPLALPLARLPWLPAGLTCFIDLAPAPYQVAGLIFSVAVLAHSAKNQSACIEGFVALEGLYCVLQFPLSCGFVAFSQERAARRGAPPSKTA